MRIVAIYNMKGGVGKTTAAVNLSHLAASAGYRTLLWDLDPQAAASFAFRVRPRVSGFGRKTLEDGEAFEAAIKETDYGNLQLLPADFAYRKFERFLGSFGKPNRRIRSLLETIGRDFDVVFLDCPAGFSLLTEGILAASDAILVPTIPTVLSLRTIARVIKWADQCDSHSRLAVFFSMVDRRKALHRRACELSAAHADLFLTTQIPYASLVEQMTVRRMPLAAFAAREPATIAFAQIWTELETWFQHEENENVPQPDRWIRMLRAIETMIERLESADGRESQAESVGKGNVDIVHRFDTEGRDLERGGYVLELREHTGSLLIVARSDDAAAPANGAAHARIDNSWALQILSGEMSPLAALERRLGQPGPRTVADIRTIVGGRSLRRVDTRLATHNLTNPARLPLAAHA